MMFHAAPIQVPQPAWAPPSVPTVTAAAPLESSAQMQTIRKSQDRPFTIILPNLQAGALAAIPPNLNARDYTIDRSNQIAIDSQNRRPVDVPPRPYTAIIELPRTAFPLVTPDQLTAIRSQQTKSPTEPAHFTQPVIIKQDPGFDLQPPAVRTEIDSQARRPVVVPQPTPPPLIIAESPRTAFPLVTPAQLAAIDSQKRRPVDVPGNITLPTSIAPTPFRLFVEPQRQAIESVRVRPVVVPTPLFAPPNGKAAIFDGGVFVATPGNYAQLGGISSFTRADATPCATQNPSASTIATVAAGILRDGHYVAGVRTILLENGGTEVLLWNSDLTNAAWTKRGAATVSEVTTGPDGNANSATRVTLLGAQGVDDIFEAGRPMTATQRADLGFWINPISVSGTLKLTNVNDEARGKWSIDFSKLSAGWQFVTRYHAAVTVTNDFAGAVGNTIGLWFYVTAGAPLSFSVYGADIKAGLYATSTLVATTASVVRATDALTFVGVNINGTIYYHYWDLSGGVWRDEVAAYVANTAITPTLDHAYSTIAVLGSTGVLSAAQVISILAGGPTGGGGDATNRRRRR